MNDGIYDAALLGDQLCRTGYAVAALPAEVARCLFEVYRESRQFFSLSRSVKELAQGESRDRGYYPVGGEHSVSPDRPDLAEKFTVWRDATPAPQASERGKALHRSLQRYLDSMLPLVRAVVDDVGRRFASAYEGTILDASGVHAQVNYSRPEEWDRDFLLDEHEDGHLVTLVNAAADGLEIKVGEDWYPLAPKAGHVLIMPGSPLCLMTGGALQPLYHRVRNLRVPAERLSVMIFVNPDLTRPLLPWVGCDEAETLDVREVASRNPLMFGLPPLRAIAPRG